ncbi:MAG: RNA methyltransferase [Thiotrichales bacterium]|jgi:TrmH family RNA methyltransferase|nr:RNA methyltransferase [Thiotrichales bacterium]MBT5984890.1 RNA methyltransferase [Thiotrichales bacterium]MBT6771370.1 RNA methyltransferase [Thiotrichales bacterium]MBT7438554.1 RNA methyltransferase [Thiotrichales bacterium]
MSQINKETNYTLTSFDKVRIVMVNTTEPGNIGAAARAMKNMMLTQLYLVAPSNYPSAVATARASGADDVLSNAIVCSSLEEALIGVNLVIGASARQRNIKWRQLDVIETCNEIQSSVVSNNQEVAVVFGTENSGLTNEELDLCSILMTIPGNPQYFSLNVASAIQVFAYQNYVSTVEGKFDNTLGELANFEDLNSFYKHLEQALEHLGYFDSKKPQNLLMRRLRRFFGRSVPEKEEVAILRGILNKIKPYQK